MNKTTCTAPACERKILARGMCSTHYSYWHRANNGRKYKMLAKECGFCGVSFEASTKITRFCSELCAQRDRAGWSNTKTLDIHRPVLKRPTPLHIKTRNRLTSGQCRVCGAWFVSFHGDVTCSAECWEKRERDLRRDSGHRRRARERNAYVARVVASKVFEADGYRCHLCNRKTDPTKSVPHPKAPTVDHVIPLAEGGTHEPLNCRTACFLCNSTKGARGGYEQMLLVAI